MKRIGFLASILIMLLFLSACSSVGQSDNQVLVKVQNPGEKDARLVGLTVVNDYIIRVRATREEQFPEKNSLIIVPQTAKPEYTVTETDNQVTVNTKQVKATVDKMTGRVQFFDAAGNVMLQEVAQHGKTLEPFCVPDNEIGVGTLTDEQRNAWSWHAQFESPADEAFYGLGQHQSGELNMKGKNEDLFQYNTKVSIPFVLSNKNYGILWDSYSYGRWGNPNEYLQLNKAFTLYDKDGKPGALTGTYRDAHGQRIVRQEDSLYFEHAFTVTNLPKDFNLEGSKVTYEGYLEAPVDNNYHFILYYAGYMKVFLDNQEVVAERWRTAWNPNAWKFQIPMQKGKKTPIRIEWEPDGGVSYCGLRAAVPQTEEEQGRLNIWSEMARDMDYYFIAGENMDQVISGYRTLTGKAQVMPKWVMGFWQSRERYKTSGEVESTLAEFRKRHIPIDNIVQDWNYWQLDSWGSHEFEAARYPNPQAMLDSVHAMHGRFMISVWPKFYCSVKNYQELDEKGYIYRQAVQDSIYDWLGFMGSFYDAYSAEARQIFWRQMDENLYSKFNQSIDAWWMDASEPNIRDCTPMWYRKALSGPTALGSSTEYFNAYSIVNADAIYNGQRSVNPNQRVFLLTRSGFAGEQRYSTATWSGDIGTRWEDMRAQMTAGMNYSMSGVPFWGMDQGGFCVEKRYVAAQQLFDATGVENEDLKEWRELQTRWHQFGCFVPLFRTHGQWPLREVWNIAPDNHPAYQSIVYYDKLRYYLMPYLYSMAGWAHFKDYTLMRALVMDFGKDTRVNDIADQWMFGPALMACPVGYYGARSREVYFPANTGWYDLYTGSYIQGGQQLTVQAPYQQIPVFVRAGSIIPFGPAMEWSDEKPAETINLYVYQGADGQFDLYEDEGTNYNYEKGEYAIIPIRYDQASGKLSFGKRQGQFKGMLQKRHFNVVVINPNKPQALNLDSPAGLLVEYKGDEISVSL